MKRTAVITGGSNGIGRATVRMMATNGIDVLFSYYSDERARDSLLEELKDAPGRVNAVRADVGTREGVQAIFDTAVNTLGSIDILFNNAGVFLDSTFMTATEANLDRTLDVIVGDVFPDAVGCEAYDRAADPGQNHQYLIVRHQRSNRAADRLLHCKSGYKCADNSIGARAWAVWHYRQCDTSRCDSDQNQQLAVRRSRIT